MVAHGLDVQNCFKDMPNFMNYVPNFINDLPNFFRMYLGFQCPFQGGEQLAISSWGSPKEYMNHENGDRGLGSSKNGYT